MSKQGQPQRGTPQGIPSDGPVGMDQLLRGVAGRLPQGITIQHPPPHFPPGLEARLREARVSGHYLVAVFIAEEGGRLRFFEGRTGFPFDLLLRALAHFRDFVVTQDIPPGMLPPEDGEGADDVEGEGEPRDDQPPPAVVAESPPPSAAPVAAPAPSPSRAAMLEMFGQFLDERGIQ